MSGHSTEAGGIAAIGIRAHSGWAAVLAVTVDGKKVRILDRRQITVIGPDARGAAQPYHFAKNLKLAEASAHLQRCAKVSQRLAAKGLTEIIETLQTTGYRVIGAGILMASGRTLPALAETLASHPLIHTAEGEFFRNCFARACEEMGVAVRKIRERDLFDCAAKELRWSSAKLKFKLTHLGRELGPPWTQDQKHSALLAWLLVAGAKP
jgi:hypothetical protein